jgi:SPP1 gp7 family putative phage head morphogenesis protein
LIHVVRKIDDRLVDFLVSSGALPPFVNKAELRWQDLAEQKLQTKLQSVFSKTFQSLITEVQSRGIPGSEGSRQELIEKLFPDAQKFSNPIEDAAVETANRGRLITVQDLQKTGLKISFGNFGKRAEDKIRTETFKASEDTLQRLKGNIMNTLAGSHKNGLGIDEAAGKLKQHLEGVEGFRLRTIARTEINTAQGWGTNETMTEFGVEFKQWLTAKTGQVRDWHKPLHGCVIRVGEKYPNGLSYPGDRSGDIVEWINCRCRERVYIPRRGEVITATPYWP